MSTSSVEGKQLGRRVFDIRRRPDRALVQELQRLPTGNIVDAMGRFGAMIGIHPISPAAILGGPALTVRLRPGDNLMAHRAMECALPGDVLVFETGGNTTNAIWGEMMSRRAMARGIGGVVVDGAVRDSRAMAQLGFPVYCRAISPASCDKDGPGEINVEIACGSVVVQPGDVIIGDGDGVVVVPLEYADAVLVAASQKAEAEERERRGR